MKRTLALLGTLCLLVLAAPIAADSPETGIVVGRAVDSNGDAMPGVTVTLVGERGEKVTITDAEGAYRFALIAPGPYTVKGALDSYGTAESAVQVTPGTRSEVGLTMVLEAAGEITVVAEAPVINRFESTSAGTITSDVASNVTSVNSNYYSALALLPGVTSDGDLADEYPGTNGSRWMEAAVFVDGVDTTYTRRGGSRLYLPQIAVSSTSLQSTSGSAEYGRATGGVTNVTTKSGTNRFHGDYYAHRQQGDWVSEFKSHPELTERVNCQYRAVVEPHLLARSPYCNPDFFVRTEEQKDYSDLTLQGSLGGPLARNKAWFFVAAADTNTFSTQETYGGDIVDNGAYVGSRIAKLNFQPSPAHALSAYYTSSPLDVTFILGDLPADRYTATPHVFGGELLTTNWNWSASQDVFMEFKLAFHDSSEHKPLNAGDGYDLESALLEKQQDPRYPANNLGRHSPGNNFDGYIGYDGQDHWWNGWILDNGFGRNDYPRDQANARMTWFASESHEALFGVDWQSVGWVQNLQRNNTYTGNQFNVSSPSGFDVCSIIALGYRLCILQDYAPADLVGEPVLDGTRSSNVAFFARDRFSAGDHWTFNLGLRYEDQSHKNDVRRTVIDAQDVSPRIFGAYDFRGDGKMLLSLNLGRSYQHMPQDLVNNHLLEGWNGTNAFDRFIYCDQLAAFFLAHVCRGVGYTGLVGRQRPGIMWQQIDAGAIPNVDIEPYFKDEVDLSLRWALNSSWYFQASAIYWTFQNSIGTTQQRLPNGDFFHTDRELQGLRRGPGCDRRSGSGRAGELRRGQAHIQVPAVAAQPELPQQLGALQQSDSGGCQGPLLGRPVQQRELGLRAEPGCRIDPGAHRLVRGGANCDCWWTAGDRRRRQSHREAVPGRLRGGAVRVPWRTGIDDQPLRDGRREQQGHMEQLRLQDLGSGQQRPEVHVGRLVLVALREAVAAAGGRGTGRLRKHL